MTIPYALTEAEQDLLDFARRVLGGNLSEFLLSGLGEPHQTRRRYGARSTRPHKWARTYQFEIVSDDEGGLPGGRDPLVLAALLHLMWTGREGRHEVAFRDGELLEKLGWPESEESRRCVEATIERYFSTSYCVTSRELQRAERVEGQYSQVRKLITGYEVTKERLPDAPKAVLKSTVVQFAAGFYEEVSSGSKYFFGIDFEQLQLRQLTAEEVTSTQSLQ
ncbi:MAG: hypothetical protein M3441_20240 [Chloroflexota bacterium]|nr:hypothetical protein [Chloroflexota bacterium]